jgi:hypothetical protein
MPKIRLISIVKDWDTNFDDLYKFCSACLDDNMLTGTGRATWVSEEGQKILGEGRDNFIPEIIPDTYEAFVLKNAQNPNYVFAYIRSIPLKVPVIVPRRFRGRLVGKNILIEKIEDKNGASYRYKP